LAAVTIVPRWEWRTFCDGFGPAEDRLTSGPPERAGESSDLYLLSAESDASVKVRDGLMDVKRLLAVNDDGLEQWQPVLKTEFPLGRADVESVLEALAVDAPPPTPPVDTVEELAASSPDVRTVLVVKQRQHYSIAGCMAEVSELQAGDATTRTLAIEAEDPERVIAVVRELGLSARTNVCMARGIKALVGFGVRRYAVIDVGTNSVKFHIGERAADGGWRTVVDRAEVTRLGEGLEQSGRLGAEPISRTVDAIAAMAEEARQSGVAEIAAVGTAGLRIAPNSAELIAAAEKRCGVRVEVIPGDEEARLAYVATVAGLGLGPGSRVVFDTGGGSSQFTFGEDERIDERFSVNVGAARFTERFGLDGVVDAERVAEAQAAIAADLSRLRGRPAPDAIVGMGGAVTNLAAVLHALEPYDAEVVQGTVLELAEIDWQIELYRTRTAEQRREIAGLQPNRAEVILAGACVVRTVVALLEGKALTVSDRGLRHGLLVERFGLSAGGTPARSP
jgi:exopolyphosphatase / guanosine-5'-triphosphate,3'-diphosphate pyrophosphatase